VPAPASILTDTIIPLDCDDSEEAVELEVALLPSQHDALCDVNTVEVNEHMQCVGNVLVPQVPGSIPFDLMTVENLTLSDGAAKPLASDLLYQYHDEFYNDGGELLA
jgi:hypothetical protein